MKAIVLAAGKGTRMMPLTKDIPKVLVEVGGKPYLWYVFDVLHKAGITEIGLVVGYKKEKISSFLKEYGFEATLITQDEQKGTGHAVMLAREFVGNDNFLVYYGDGLFSVNDVKKVMIDDDLSYMAGKRVENWSSYGIMLFDGDFLKEKVEKPSTFIGDMAWVGFFKSTPALFDKLEHVGVSDRGEIEVTDAINMLAKEKKVKIVELTDYWLDLGKPEDIPKIESFLATSK